MLFRYTLGWFVLLIAAVVNGAIRDGMYKESLWTLVAPYLFFRLRGRGR